MYTPELYLQTCFVLNAAGRIVSTPEPGGGPGPFFMLVRGATACAWAIRADVPTDIASELGRIAKDEPVVRDFRDPPVNAHRYLRMLETVRGTSPSSGPAFSFPDAILECTDAVVVASESLLAPNFRGWMPGELD